MSIFVDDSIETMDFLLSKPILSLRRNLNMGALEKGFTVNDTETGEEFYICLNKIDREEVPYAQVDVFYEGGWRQSGLVTERKHFQPAEDFAI